MQAQERGLSRRSFLKAMAATATPLLLAACAPPAANAPASSSGGASAPAQAVAAVRYIAMDYDSRMQPDTQAVMDAFNSSQGEVSATPWKWSVGRRAVMCC